MVTLQCAQTRNVVCKIECFSVKQKGNSLTVGIQLLFVFEDDVSHVDTYV
jgi:hypothetical protein